MGLIAIAAVARHRGGMSNGRLLSYLPGGGASLVGPHAQAVRMRAARAVSVSFTRKGEGPRHAGKAVEPATYPEEGDMSLLAARG